MNDPANNVLSCKIPTRQKFTNLYQIGTKLFKSLLGLIISVGKLRIHPVITYPASLYPIMSDQRLWAKRSKAL